MVKLCCHLVDKQVNTSNKLQLRVKLRNVLTIQSSVEIHKSWIQMYILIYQLLIGYLGVRPLRGEVRDGGEACRGGRGQWVRKGEEGGGGRGLGGNHVADPRREHGRVWHGSGGGGGVSCDGIGLLGDEVRDEVRELAVEGDVELLPSTLAGLRLLLQVCVHAGVLRVVAPPTLLLHLDGRRRQLGGVHGDSSGGGVIVQRHVSCSICKHCLTLRQHHGLMGQRGGGRSFRRRQVIIGLCQDQWRLSVSLSLCLIGRLRVLARRVLANQEQ